MDHASVCIGVVGWSVMAMYIALAFISNLHSYIHNCLAQSQSFMCLSWVNILIPRKPTGDICSWQQVLWYYSDLTDVTVVSQLKLWFIVKGENLGAF